MNFPRLSATSTLAACVAPRRRFACHLTFFAERLVHVYHRLLTYRVAPFFLRGGIVRQSGTRLPVKTNYCGPTGQRGSLDSLFF